MASQDWYILKFNFDLRNTATSIGGFAYNSASFTNTGDVIFMRNCRTILLRVGATALAITTPGSTALNARVTSLLYNPPHQLTTAEGIIIAYAVYNSID